MRVFIVEQKLTKDEMFDNIYRSYAVEVFHACLYMAKDVELAEEMTQQAFVNFYERFETVKLECAKTYIVRSAKNLLSNYYRDTKREVQDEWGAEVLPAKEQATESIEDDYFRKEKEASDEEFSARILADLQENRPNWYDIIHRMFYLGMSHDEIAEELGVTKDVLYSRLRRAKVWLRKRYEDEFENRD